MANRLQLKRGSGAPGTIFYEGEPVYDKSGKVLYVGDNGGSGSGAGSAVASAGAYSAVTEILNQASDTSSGFIKLLEDTDNGNHNVSLKAPASIGSNYTLVLPDGTGSAGQVLKTDGSGNLDWVNQTSGYSGFSISDGSNSQSVESGGTVTFTGGNGISAVVSATDTLTISADLKSNGGLIIGPAPGETTLALDLGASNIYGTLAISDGGTGATTAAAARAGLGVSIGTDVQAFNAILADLAGLTQAANKLAYFDSSTTAATTDLTAFGRTLVGTASSATARSELGVDAAGTDNSTDVTLVTTSYDYLSISGQAITLGQITNDDLANNSITVSDGTNSSTRALGETLTIQGTANEVTVTESSGTVTVALPDDVTIGNDLTVNGNLNVVGTAVTFSAETTRIEDRILELGLVNGAAPTSATTWDLGVAFNYFDSSAKKSALVWLNNQFVGIASAITETADNTASADPQITIDGFGSLAAKDLYLGGTASSNQIINSSGAAVNLVFDGGSY